MENAKTKYEEIKIEREKIEAQLLILADTETVKKYLELCQKNFELSIQQEYLYKKLKVNSYSLCNHIWVIIDNNKNNKYSNNHCGCIKCGLDKRVFYLMQLYHDLDYLTVDQKIMYEFMRKHFVDSGTKTGIFCDFDLAKAVYAKIMEAHPDIDDETAIKYLNVAINDIKNIEVSDERKKDRAKRLSLKS